MNTTIARRIGRYVALPVVSAGIIGGAALGLAGMANAATPSYNPEPRPGIVAVPRPRPSRPPRPTPARGGTGITRRCSIRRLRRSSWRPSHNDCAIRAEIRFQYAIGQFGVQYV